MAFTVEQIVTNGRVASMGLLRPATSSDHDLVERAMIYTDVLAMRDRFFGELSGGEQQRVALAMVLAQEPKLIMLDESISHLDINHRNEVLQILLKLNREEQLTILLVSHDLSLSAAISDRLILMQDGAIRAAGIPKDVLRLISSAASITVIFRFVRISIPGHCRFPDRLRVKSVCRQQAAGCMLLPEGERNRVVPAVAA